MSSSLKVDTITPYSTTTVNMGAVTITSGSITGITAIAVADGGTGASTAANARTNLGLGTIATQNSNNITVTGGSITGITVLLPNVGGTGVATHTSGGLLTGAGSGAITTTNAAAKGDVIGGTGANAWGVKTAGADNTLVGYDSSQTTGLRTFTTAGLLTASSGVLTASAPATQTFLGSDVALNNASNYFNICNTGSIGATGQMWSIRGVAAVTDTASSSQIKVRIWDGSSTVYVETVTFNTLGSGSAGEVVYVEAIVTLSAATTFHLSAKSSATTGTVLTTGSAGTANKATWIVAQRLS